MNTNDSYNPSNAAAQTLRVRQSRLWMYLVLGLVAIQMLATLRYNWAFRELVHGGVVRPLGLFLGGPASICLAAFLFPFKPRHSKTLFAVAAAGLGMAAPFWWGSSNFGKPYFWSIIVIAGALLGATGWWFSRVLTPDPNTDVQGK
jgi:hypothetical protein